MADNDRTTAMADERPPIWVASISHSLDRLNKKFDALSKVIAGHDSPNTDHPKRLITTRELAEKHRISRGTIYHAARSGQLPAAVRGKGRRGLEFWYSDFLKWLIDRSK